MTVGLYDRGGKTELVLAHRGFTTDTSRGEHDEGWKQCLDRMAAVVA